MENVEILNNLVTIVTPYCKNTALLNKVEGNMRFIEDLGVNSARLVDIILDIEDKFGVSIEDSAGDKIRTVKDAIELIEAKIALLTT